MEYSSWMEYLIKIACAIYTIDPTEIGWDISRGGGSSLFEGSQEQRLKHSKDKGLYPLLKFLQRKINRYIVEQINPEYELVFMGLNGLSIEDELKMDIDKLNSFMTVNEIRDKYDLKPIEEGDSPNNSVYLQAKNMAQQQAMQQQMQETQGNFEEENPFDAYSDYDEEEENPFDAYSDDETEKSERNELFIKAFDNFLEKEENKKDNIIGKSKEELLNRRLYVITAIEVWRENRLDATPDRVAYNINYFETELQIIDKELARF